MNSWALRLASRVSGLFRQKKAESEFDDEMQIHLQLLTEKFIRQGMGPEDADSAARRQFGNTALLRQRHRESRTFLSFSTVFQDVRYGLRVLGKSPGFTVTALLTLGLGIGANAAIFTLIHATLLQDLPVPQPEQLIRVGDDHRGGISWFSTKMYDQLRNNTPEFRQLAAMQASIDNSWITLHRQ